MPRITIVGSGILGLSIAGCLSRNHEVLIVARDLPGDEPSIEWASPWAGASWVAGPCPTEDRRIMLDSFAELWRLSASHPESSLRRITVEDFFRDATKEDIWWQHHVPDFRFLSDDSQLPPDAKFGVSYRTVILNPNVFLPWLRDRLQGSGVSFRRMTIKSLSDLATLGHDVLINATGIGAQWLDDVKDAQMQMVRGQTILVRGDYNQGKMYMFDKGPGSDYTYAIPRLDGTFILGGVRQPGSKNPEVEINTAEDILRRLHRDKPDVFSPNLNDYDIVRHNIGIRPGRTTMRIEKELRGTQKIVHSYGFSNGGYIYGHGVARQVVRLVDEFLYTNEVAADTISSLSPQQTSSNQPTHIISSSVT